eukprot:2380692-Pyramimonas_sp.AAC.1
MSLHQRHKTASCGVQRHAVDVRQGAGPVAQGGHRMGPPQHPGSRGPPPAPAREIVKNALRRRVQAGMPIEGPSYKTWLNKP